MDVLVSLLVLVIILAIALFIVRLLVTDAKLLQIAYLIIGGIALIYLLGILFGHFPMVPYGRR